MNSITDDPEFKNQLLQAFVDAKTSCQVFCVMTAGQTRTKLIPATFRAHASLSRLLELLSMYVLTEPTKEGPKNDDSSPN